MIKVLIIDDEINAINLLSKLIEQEFPNQFSIETASGAEEGLDKIGRFNPKLVLLDVEMPIMNGFELLSAVPEINFMVIFTTAFDRYAIQAIKYSALDYILKPIRISELGTSISKFLGNTENNRLNYTKQMDNFLSRKNKNLAITTMEGIAFLEIQKIIRCEAEDNYTHFFLADSPPFIASKTLKEYDELLVPHKNFMRVHRSHLINLDYVIEFRNEGSLVLKDHSVVPISRTKKEEVIQRLNVIR